MGLLGHFSHGKTDSTEGDSCLPEGQPNDVRYGHQLRASTNRHINRPVLLNLPIGRRVLGNDVIHRDLIIKNPLIHIETQIPRREDFGRFFHV